MDTPSETRLQSVRARIRMRAVYGRTVPVDADDLAWLIEEVERLQSARRLENEDLAQAFDKGLAAGRAQEKAALARCMDCPPDEVYDRIQAHAPWNGQTMCEDAVRERAAVAALFRSLGLSAMACGVEVGAHLKLTERSDIERSKA
jgi:hypothetical protein